MELKKFELTKNEIKLLENIILEYEYEFGFNQEEFEFTKKFLPDFKPYNTIKG